MNAWLGGSSLIALDLVYYGVLQKDDPRKLLAENSMDLPREKPEHVSHDASP